MNPGASASPTGTPAIDVDRNEETARSQDFWRDVPSARQVSPDAATATVHNLEFLRRHGLLPDDAAREWQLTQGAGEVIGRAFPHARGGDLDLATDAFIWTALFDDLFGTPIRRPAEHVAMLRAQLQAVTAAPTVDTSGVRQPLATALADIWSRSTVGMSAAWIDRAARHWQEFIEISVVEAEDRRHGVLADLADYTKRRRVSVATYIFADLIERVGHFEVPARALDDRRVWAVAERCSDLCVLLNDLGSLTKEEADGDSHNIIPVLQRTQAISRDTAVAAVQQMFREQYADFRLRRDQLPALPTELKLSPDQSAAVVRWATRLEHLVSANHYLLRQTRRYTLAGNDSASMHSYVEGIMSAPTSVTDTTAAGGPRSDP
jgi:hypothetical protein